ncbi:MAG TPA: hypothetical protein VIU46_02335 [Gallionellaceae bacterium]
MNKLLTFIATTSIIAAFCLSGTASGEETSPDANTKEIRLPENSHLFGSWRGKLGDQEVMVCIADRHAAYYAVGHYSRITLTLADSSALIWKEGYPAGHQGIWKLDADNDEAVTGTWSAREGTAPIPIRLNRMRSKEKNLRFCEEIYRELASAEPITRGKEQGRYGMRYREVSVLGDSVSSIEVLGGNDTVSALNKYLRDDFQNKIVSTFACQDMNFFETDENRKIPYTRRVSLFTVNGPWITLLDRGGGRCGAEHADNLQHLTTLELETAQPLKLAEWLVKNDENDHVDEDGRLYSPPEELTALLYEFAGKLEKKIRTKEDPDCEAIIDPDPFEPILALSLGDKGIIFSTSYAPATANFCDVWGVEIPFPKLTQFLSPKGKQAIKILQQSKHEKSPGKSTSALRK